MSASADDSGAGGVHGDTNSATIGAPTADGGRGAGALDLRPSDKPRYWIDHLLRDMGRGRWLSLRRASLAWGFGGFLIGAVFWHLIGFWGFLTNVVLKDTGPSLSVVARQSIMLPVALPNCTVLALDRLTGRTYSVSCADKMPVLEEARRGRQDFAFAHLRVQEGAGFTDQTGTR